MTTSSNATEFLASYRKVVEKFFGDNDVTPFEFLNTAFWPAALNGGLFDRRHEFIWYIVVAKCVVHSELYGLPEEEQVMVRLLTSGNT